MAAAGADTDTGSKFSPKKRHCTCMLVASSHSLTSDYVSREGLLYYKVKLKKKDVSRPDFYKRERGEQFFLLFIISYCMRSLHIITFPQGYVGAPRSNINKTKLIIIYIILVCTQQQRSLHIFDVIRTPS